MSDFISSDYVSTLEVLFHVWKFKTSAYNPKNMVCIFFLLMSIKYPFECRNASTEVSNFPDDHADTPLDLKVKILYSQTAYKPNYSSIIPLNAVPPL